MKILFVTCFDSPGGQSNRSYLFAKEFNKIGHNVTYFTNRYNHLDDHKRSIRDLKLDNNIKHIFENIISISFCYLKIKIFGKKCYNKYKYVSSYKQGSKLLSKHLNNIFNIFFF